MTVKINLYKIHYQRVFKIREVGIEAIREAEKIERKLGKKAAKNYLKRVENERVRDGVVLKGAIEIAFREDATEDHIVNMLKKSVKTSPSDVLRVTKKELLKFISNVAKQAL